jgi:hypothetical protein
MKLASKLWLYRLEKKQIGYLQSLDDELEVIDGATLPVMQHQHTVHYYCFLHNGDIELATLSIKYLPELFWTWARILAMCILVPTP